VVRESDLWRRLLAQDPRPPARRRARALARVADDDRHHDGVVAGIPSSDFVAAPFSASRVRRIGLDSKPRRVRRDGPVPRRRVALPFVDLRLADELPAAR
jgi:hypothetical protein